VAEDRSPVTAARYVDAIILATFPHRGTKRDEIRPGSRISGRRFLAS
jgi:plasmid stabilization system protein ParE